MEHLQEILTTLSLPGMGKSSFHQKYGSKIGTVTGSEELAGLLLEKSGGKYSAPQVRQAWDGAGQFLESLLNYPDITVLTFLDDAYPASLRSMGNSSPPVLYVRGDPSVLSLPNIGVVGTRRPSPLTTKYGPIIVKHMQSRTSRVIVSGLALGCDGIAHEAAINAGLKTVAVLPSGVLRITPATHNGLAERILETGGCLISEYGLRNGVTKFTYVERDSVIAGLSDGLLVLECGIRSGTMHTVDAAEQLSRPLACFIPPDVPPSLFDGNWFMADTKGAFAFQGPKGLGVFLDRLDRSAKHSEPDPAPSSVQQITLEEQTLPEENHLSMPPAEEIPEMPASQEHHSVDDESEQMALPGFDSMPTPQRTSRNRRFRPLGAGRSAGSHPAKVPG